jgi:antitoxin component YwqK of YwqJK toxin-antitoxin module
MKKQKEILLDKKYFPSGKIKSICGYVDGHLHGKYTQYYEEGTTEWIGYYKKGKKTSWWYKYDNDGTVLCGYHCSGSGCYLLSRFDPEGQFHELPAYYID